MKKSGQYYLNKAKEIFQFPEDSYAFGTTMPGKTKRDLFLLIFSVSIGMLYTVITSFPNISPLFSAFLKDYLGVNNTIYAIFVALPFISALIQLPFAKYLQKHPRIKNFFIGLSFVAKFNWALIGVLTLHYNHNDKTNFVMIVLFLQLISSLTFWMADLCFSIWIGETCPPGSTGRFLSTRQMFFTASQLIYALLFSIILKALENSQYQYLILFILAGVFGSLDIIIFFFIQEPSLEIITEQDNTPQKSIGFLEVFKNKSYRNFLWFCMFWNFGNFITGPFVNVYMLEDLHLPLSIQTLYGSFVMGLSTVLFIRLSGTWSDRYGYRNTTILFSFLAALSPLIWIQVTPSSHFLIAINNFLWGLSGISVDMNIFSLGISLAPKKHRSQYLAVKAICINLLAIAPSILFGGVLMDLLNEVMADMEIPFIWGQKLHPFHVLNFIAIVIRMIAVFGFAVKLDKDNEMNVKEFLFSTMRHGRFRFKSMAGLLNKNKK